MDHWSIKDLKTFCEQQGIDHRDCVEKPELVKVASAHAQGLFEAHRSGAKSREDSGARSGGASATGASATGAGAAESAATAGGGRSSSEAKAKARVNLEKLEVGARLYEKFAEASRALGLDDVGTSDAVRAPPLGTPALRPLSPEPPAGPAPLAQALNQVYKKLARKYHPDKNPDDPERAAARCEPLASDPVPAL